jgi:hypothetical protein
MGCGAPAKARSSLKPEATLQSPENESQGGYKTHAELWAAIEEASLPPEVEVERLPWTAPILSAKPSLEVPRRSPKPNPSRERPAAGIYWTLAIAVGVLMLGLINRPDTRKVPASDTPSVVASAPTAAPMVTPPPPSFVDDPDQPYFMIVLDPPLVQTPASQDLEARLRDATARAGFPDLGVTVTHYGEVFIAGAVVDPAEKDEILGLVHRVRGVSEIRADDIVIRKPSGCAYFGAETEPDSNGPGVKVTKVYSYSPAELAGIKSGDIITRFGIQYVMDPESFRYMVRSHEGGQRVAVTLMRDGGAQTVMVRLGEVPSPSQGDMASSD